jgi:serine/threonine protein kinase
VRLGQHVQRRLVVARLEPTLRFLHARGWLHGDVKPGNIFLDFAGDSWLGDFGSSTPIAAAAQGEVAGGTPAYQSEEVSAAHEPIRFDLVGLAAAALELLGLLAPASAPWSGWPRGALAAAAARINDDTLRVRVEALLAGEVAA